MAPFLSPVGCPYALNTLPVRYASGGEGDKRAIGKDKTRELATGVDMGSPVESAALEELLA